MIKIAICDDEAPTRAYLAALVQAQGCPCTIAEYTCAADYLNACQECDLLFLDIELGANSLGGMALAAQIRKTAFASQPIIIFVTGYEQYVFDAFDVGAFHYLLKPVDEKKFTQVFTRAGSQLKAKGEKTSQTLTLQWAGVSRTVPLKHIYYIESSDHKVVLHLADGEFSCYAKIRDLEAELANQFCRVHTGYLANLSHVEAYSKIELTLANGEKLPISKYKYQDFVKAYLRFLKKEQPYE